MKKLLLLLLLVTVIVGLLVACGTTEDTTVGDTTTEGDITTTQGDTTTTTGDSTTAPESSTVADTTSTPDSSTVADEPVTPTEKTLTLDPSNFQSYPAIVLNGVVENTQYTNEFTFNKNGSSMTSSGITGITKIVAHVYGTYDNLKMYKGASESGTLVTATVADKDANKEYTYTFDGSTDAFYLTNPSEYNVHLFSLTIYYTGTVSGEATDTPDNSDTPATPAGTVSIEEAITIANGLAESAKTDATYTIVGVITGVAEKEITLTQNGKSIVCYLGTGTYENLRMGYTVTLTGNLQNYYGTPELVYFTVDSYESVTYTVTSTIPDNGTLSISKVSGINWGETITVTATPDNGYVLDSLKVNGLKVQVTDGKYTVKMTESITVEVTFAKEGAVAESLAKFDFGANVDGAHADGNEVKTETSYTAGNYTLTITNPNKLYDGANDETGVSCLKLGTSKAIGSFSFTVPEDVKTVVIYVAGYKAKTSKITINGGAQMTISTSSNDGAYTPIEIDTSTNKTVTVSTVDNAYRVMIDAIEFKA